ncbi:MAG: cold shock domain-containing protein [Patescibacteria group bacterium]
MNTGVIKTITGKGFGFITKEGEEKDIFFHSTACVGVSMDELNVGDNVTFDIEESEKGPRAVNVQRA